ncbi:MAG: transcription elongation factor [Desulfurococcaceae archaeon]
MDKICVKSGVFCPSCQRKIESKIVDEDEIPVIRTLMDLEDELKFLSKKGEYIKSIITEDEIFVIIKNGFEMNEINILERNLTRELGKKVKVIESTGDTRKLIEKIISPASLLGINRVWIPGGMEILNIRVSRRDRKLLERNRESYEMLIEKLLGIKTQIVFE